LPGAVIFAPSDEAECRDMLYTAYQHKGLTAVRYPRGAGIGAPEREQMLAMEIGKSITVREGQGVAILSFGTLLAAAISAAQQLDATVIDMRFVKPLDEARIIELAASHDLIVTLEENVIAGGAGSGVNEFLSDCESSTPTLNLGLPDQYIDHGSQTELLAQCGLNADGIEASIRRSRFFKPTITQLQEQHS